MCVSSTFVAVGDSPRRDWFQVVSRGRKGLASAPLSTLSLSNASRIAELLLPSCALSLRLVVSRSVELTRPGMVWRSTCCLP